MILAFGRSRKVFSIAPSKPPIRPRPRRCLLGPIGSPQQLSDHGVYRSAAMQHRIDPLADRHLDAELLAQSRDGRGGGHPLYNRTAFAKRRVEALPATEGETEREIARLGRTAGQHEVAEP